MRTILLDSLAAWWPEIVLSLGGLFVLVLGAVAPRRRPVLAASGVALAAAAWALWHAPVPPSTDVFFGMVLCDRFSLAFRWFTLGVLALSALLIAGSREVHEQVHGEYLALVLFAGVGMMLMAEANHLLIAYVAMELVSLSSYAMVGLTQDARSAEASLKYLLFGALASGVMLFGMSLVYGLTGSLAFADIQQSVAALSGPMAKTLLAAVALVLTGLAFKISMVPFHMWTPDAYEGAPVPVTAFLSVGPKAAGLALLLRLTEVMAPIWPSLAPLLMGLAIATMTLGNLVALAQRNVKRLLAYSTIAQVGYLLIGFVVQTRQGLEALLFYLVAYLFMNMGAFAAVVAVVRDTGSESIEAFRGLSQRSPALAALTTLFLLSLAGIPPLAGFLGKFLLFGAAVESGRLPLAIAGLVNSAIALYYYVNIIGQMYLAAPSKGPLWASFPIRLAVSVCGVLSLGLGLWPSAILLLVRASSQVNLL